MGVLEDLLNEVHDVKKMVYDLKMEVKIQSNVPTDPEWILGERAAEILECSYVTLKINKDKWDLKYRRAGHKLQFFRDSVKKFQERSSTRTFH